MSPDANDEVTDEQRSAVTSVDAAIMFTCGLNAIIPDRDEHARVCAIVFERPDLTSSVISIIRERVITDRDGVLAVLAEMGKNHPAVQEGTL